LVFAALGLVRLAALAGGFGRDLVLAAAVFAVDVFATGITQNLKQRAYNHNRHKEESKSKDGNHHKG
jgi:hypothetical protein